MPDDRQLLSQATDIQARLAESLPPFAAKLYAEHTRLARGQEGLRAWGHDEAERRLDDVFQLVHAASVLRRNGTPGWQISLRRAGELLEWLNHSELNPEDRPLSLLAAACYQLAGYPARAESLLRLTQRSSIDSQILVDFLRADFQSTLARLSNYWSAFPEISYGDDVESLSRWQTDDTLRTLSVIVAEMRWGGQQRLRPAIRKLHALSQVAAMTGDAYSALLSQLVSSVASEYAVTSMRSVVKPVVDQMQGDGGRAIERYLRVSYREGKTLAWPSQARGVQRLVDDSSFAIFTPTGSGKTTVAEVAILQSLFGGDDRVQTAPLVLYLTPSRALCVEVERRLGRVLRNLQDDSVRVTGLYGGTDWGPTDAWLTVEEPTVVICTYEKAEALVRFLGPLFLSRVVLVVLDEAHSLQLTNSADLVTGDNRALRLESLGSRMLTHLASSNARFIAMSAVAGVAEVPLTAWATGGDAGARVATDYRSTRQLVGRLLCRSSRTFEMQFDALDGALIDFEDSTELRTRPFVPRPFPQMPEAHDFDGPQKVMRPRALWAALQLAATSSSAPRGRSVLISVTQKPGDYANSFLDLLEGQWADFELPEFFIEPDEQHDGRLWQQALASCEDYFGTSSRDFRLLERGIAVHHGNMPGLLSRLIVELADRRIVRIVLATSTLSEGVNLPFEVVLIPNLFRYSDAQTAMPLPEFKNLIGRAGRPGFGTEGQALVLLDADASSRSAAWGHQQALLAYERLLGELVAGDEQRVSPVSALAMLLRTIQNRWVELNPEGSQVDFHTWLEAVTPTAQDVSEDADLVDGIDTLDAVLLAGLVEAEVRQGDVELEHALRELWRHTYAHYVVPEEAAYEETFVRRGVAVGERIFPQSEERARLYRTSLRPTDAQALFEVYPIVVERLQAGRQYVSWSPEQRYDFIRDISDIVSRVPKFGRNRDRVGSGRGVAWDDILRWWVRAPAAPTPTEAQIAQWHQYVNQNFGYRFSWGLGSIVGAAIAERHGDDLVALTFDDWAQGELPWITFWLKELMVWGTLEPVAAYLMARRLATTRDEAERRAANYYSGLDATEVSDPLDARSIGAWVRGEHDQPQISQGPVPPSEIRVTWLAQLKTMRPYRVVPVRRGEGLGWADVAGYVIAESDRPPAWRWTFRDSHDFVLRPNERLIHAAEYA